MYRFYKTITQIPDHWIQYRNLFEKFRVIKPLLFVLSAEINHTHLKNNVAN